MMVNMKALCPSDTLINLYQTMWRHIREDNYEFGIDMGFGDQIFGFWSVT
jgi:hypothetical protein